MTFSEFLKDRREKLNLSQTDIACELGILKQTVSRWENDVSLPDIMIIPKLAEILNVSPYHIVDVIWGGKSLVGSFYIKVSDEFEINKLNYYFGKVRKIDKDIYAIRCLNETLNEFIEQYYNESKIKIVQPVSKKESIIFGNLPSCDNYSEEDKFYTVINYCLKRHSIVLRGRYILHKSISGYNLFENISNKFVECDLFNKFKLVYENSNSQVKFDELHKWLCDIIIDIYMSEFSFSLVVVEKFNKIKYYETQCIVNSVFKMMNEIGLVDGENIKYFHNKCPYALFLNNSIDWSNYDEYLKNKIYLIETGDENGNIKVF